MNKSGLYINGNKVCDIHQYSIIKIIPNGDIDIQANSVGSTSTVNGNVYANKK